MNPKDEIDALVAEIEALRDTSSKSMVYYLQVGEDHEAFVCLGGKYAYEIVIKMLTDLSEGLDAFPEEDEGSSVRPELWLKIIHLNEDDGEPRYTKSYSNRYLSIEPVANKP